MFKGSYVALITPFKNGEIDTKKLIDLVGWHISEGTDGLVPVGTTGESTTLSHEEHLKVIDIVVKAAQKKIPVIAGAGSNSTEEAISLTREAKKLGVDAVLSVNPYYNRPTQAGLKAHFSAIAKAVNIPIILYNIPSRTGVNLLPLTMASLAAENSNIVGVKESSGNLDQATEIRLHCGSGFLILSGDDSLTLPLMAVGALGVISVAANLIPKEVAQLCRLVLSQNLEQAQRLHEQLFPIFKALFIETNPAPIKAAMQIVGLIESDQLRLPLVSIQPDTREKLISAMRTLKIKEFTSSPPRKRESKVSGSPIETIGEDK